MKNLRKTYIIGLIALIGVVLLVLIQQKELFSSEQKNGDTAGNVTSKTIIENNFDEDIVQKNIYVEAENIAGEAQGTNESANSVSSTGTSTTTSSTKTTTKTTAPKTTTKPTTPTTPSPTSPSSCPAQTLNCVPCNKADGNTYCRYEAGKTSGYLGWSCQNNNPGNIRPATTAYPNCSKGSSYDRTCIIVNNGGPAPCGVRTDEKRGQYMIFKTYTDGKDALRAYIKGVNGGQHKAYPACGNCTLRYFLGKYSANTTTYPEGIASKLGVNADTTTLAWVIQNGKLEQLVSAIQAQEGFFTK